MFFISSARPYVENIRDIEKEVQAYSEHSFFVQMNNIICYRSMHMGGLTYTKYKQHGKFTDSHTVDINKKNEMHV